MRSSNSSNGSAGVNGIISIFNSVVFCLPSVCVCTCLCACVSELVCLFACLLRGSRLTAHYPKNEAFRYRWSFSLCIYELATRHSMCGRVGGKARVRSCVVCSTVQYVWGTTTNVPIQSVVEWNPCIKHRRGITAAASAVDCVVVSVCTHDKKEMGNRNYRGRTNRFRKCGGKSAVNRMFFCFFLRRGSQPFWNKDRGPSLVNISTDFLKTDFFLLGILFWFWVALIVVSEQYMPASDYWTIRHNAFNVGVHSNVSSSRSYREKKYLHIYILEATNWNLWLG